MYNSKELHSFNECFQLSLLEANEKLQSASSDNRATDARNVEVNKQLKELDEMKKKLQVERTNMEEQK